MPTLSPTETRVLGALLEKERLTPDQYPLSLNALLLACNQSTSREPVMALDEKELEAALENLRFEHKLATVFHGAGSRVQKYRHNLLDIFQLTPPQVALLCALLLRGPQTAAELRARTERLTDPSFATAADAEAALETLAAGPEPLVRRLPARPGQKERRYVQLLSGEPTVESGSFSPSAEFAPARAPATPSRLETLEGEVAALRAELGALKEEFAAFRRQFE